MQPWLIQLDLPLLGRVMVSSYFFFLMLGCAAGTEVSIREGRRSGLEPRRVLFMSVTAVLSGLVGARVAHLVFVVDGWQLTDPLALLRVWEGGMVFYGGLIGGIVAVAVLARRWGIPLARLGDVYAAPVLVGLAFGRIGCLANGCCYGRPIDWGTGVEWPWAAVFLHGEVPSALRGIPLHPTQAYAVFNAVLLLLAIGWLRRRQTFDGQVFGVLLVGYGLSRSVLELFRFDLGRSFWFEDALGQLVSTSQGISIPLVLLGVWLLVRGRRSGGLAAS